MWNYARDRGNHQGLSELEGEHTVACKESVSVSEGELEDDLMPQEKKSTVTRTKPN